MREARHAAPEAAQITQSGVDDRRSLRKFSHDGLHMECDPLDRDAYFIEHRTAQDDHIGRPMQNTIMDAERGDLRKFFPDRRIFFYLFGMHPVFL